MGINYNCKKAKVLQELGNDRLGRRMVLAELQCQNEHGQELAPTKAVVVVGENSAKIEKYAENLLPEDASDEDYERLQALCDLGPDYNLYNDEEAKHLFG